MKQIQVLTRLLQLGALIWASSGCVHYQPHPLDAAQGASALQDRRLARRTWTLTQLSAEAARHSPDVTIARAQYETARAAIRTAGERPNPTLALSPQVVTPFTAFIAGTYGVDFDWTIETAGKRIQRMQVAHENVRASAARTVDTIWKSRSAIRKALLDLYAAEQRGKLLAAALTQQEDLLKTIDVRISAGAEPRSSSWQAQLLQTQLRLQQSDANRAAGLARAALAEALGMGVRGLEGALFSFTPFEKTMLPHQTARFAALTHRADVLAALADYAAAEASLRLEVAKQYPDVHLQPGYQLDAGVNKWSIGLGLTLPILNQNQGAIGEAEAKRKEMAVRFAAVQARVLADCDRAAAALQAARAKLDLTEQMLQRQARQIESEQKLRAAGEGDKLSVLSAQVERAATLTARLDALVELQTAFGALEDATQTPLER